MTRPPHDRPAATPVQTASFSIPAILAAVCVALIFLTEWFDVALAIGAIVFGLIGAAIAVSPAKRGGILSILAIVVGVISVIVSIFQVLLCFAQPDRNAAQVQFARCRRNRTWAALRPG